MANFNSAHRVAVLEPELRRQVDAELDAGERIVWLGQPVAALMARQAWPVVLFGVPWTAFAIFWTLGAAGMIGRHGTSGGSATGWFAYVFPLWGLPFIAIGFAMLTAPYWAARTARQTIYALTDRRAIVWQAKGWGKFEVHNFQPERLTSMTRKQRGDGSGDLIFEQFQERNGSGTTTIRRGFMAVPDVQEVEDLIRETLLAPRYALAQE